MKKKYSDGAECTWQVAAVTWSWRIGSVGSWILNLDSDEDRDEKIEVTVMVLSGEMIKSTAMKCNFVSLCGEDDFRKIKICHKIEDIFIPRISYWLLWLLSIITKQSYLYTCMWTYTSPIWVTAYRSVMYLIYSFYGFMILLYILLSLPVFVCRQT